MILQDHFRPPLNVRRHWHAFHNAWATYIASDLNRQLPEGYFAEANVQFGIEIDDAAFEEITLGVADERAYESDQRTMGTVAAWIAPSPTCSVPFSVLTAFAEVLVFSQEAGPTLLGAIELVSPANKDRPAQRNAFVSKCAAYLQQGIGLIIVDVVTERRANLHKELLKLLNSPEGPASAAELYAVAYRPVMRAEEPNLDIWEEPLAVGKALPTMPLWLPGSLCVPVNLGGTYDRTCREQRILPSGV
jgi:hypothetical protein